MTLTRKDFEQIAKILNAFVTNSEDFTKNINRLIQNFINYCDKSNANFDRERFLRAIYQNCDAQDDIIKNFGN